MRLDKISKTKMNNIIFEIVLYLVLILLAVLMLYPLLFPRATSQVAMLAWIFGDCREGQIPRCLQRCKFETPLLAAGSLICAECIFQ